MPGHVEPVLDVLLELAGDLVGVGPQGLRVLVVGVVGVVGGQLADGRLALDGHEVLIALDVEDGLGRIDDVPDDDGGDLDRVAQGVVDLDRLAVEVEDAQGHLLLDDEGIGPEEAGRPGGADVLAEEGEDLGLVGVDEEEAAEGHEDEDASEDGDDHPGSSGRTMSDVGDKIPAAEEEDDEVDGGHEQAVDAEDGLFLDVFHAGLL